MQRSFARALESALRSARALESALRRAGLWALAISLAAGLLAWTLVRPASALRTVVVVTRDLAPGALIARPALDFRDLPEAYVEDRHISADDVERLIGMRITTAVASGASLLWTDLALAEPERTLASLVQVGMRALSLPANDFGGQLRSGDRVDVLFTPRLPERATWDHESTITLLDNALVLSVGSDSERHVTLGVSPRDAQRVAGCEGRGALRLALRNPHDVALAVAEDAQEEP